MSEELLQTKPHKLNRYWYYKLGNSTLKQLKLAGIIPIGQIPKGLGLKRPDGLIVMHRTAIKAVIEYKTPSELKTPRKIKAAIDQELDVAKLLCKLLIVTDGDKSFWVNALNGEQITDEKGNQLKTFSAKRILEGQTTNEEITQLEVLLDKIEHSLTETNSSLIAPKVLDPSQLARTLWQKIWINTGKNPEQCLYNVVELFIFKFLSDVGVLNETNNFDSVYALKGRPQDALKRYANVCRKEIRELFPAGQDGTTIINGTIFVNQEGEPNLPQAGLFAEVLEHLMAFANKEGSFRHIQREFKTRLYESFLRQEAGIKLLGQYFTPRNVVRAMVEMSSARNLQPGARICDPFCGVGGFLLETIAGNQHIYDCFEPRNGKVSPSFTLLGFDKGTDEREDERTIILAKANMLIYFSDLLAKYNSHKYLKAFSVGAFNKVFNLLRSNLGTFAKVGIDPFDLILTNPPYVTSGSHSLKRAISETNIPGLEPVQALSTWYTAGGRGTESLALEWVIRHLKPGGEALIVVPDGLMNQKPLREFAMRHCTIQAIISLPSRTFYSTSRKTYILIIKRKRREEELQTNPVFSYLVSEIGESRDSRRLPIEENDLNEATALYNQFKGDPTSFRAHMSKRCNITPFDEFIKLRHWMIDRLWDKEDKLELGIVDEKTEISEEEFFDLVSDAMALLGERWTPLVGQ